MLPAVNATSVSCTSQMFNNPNPQTQLSANLVRTGNSPRGMFELNATASAVSVATKADIPTPVLASSTLFSFNGDFSNQSDVEDEWSSLKHKLATMPLTQEEAVDVLRSGILFTAPGLALVDLFEDSLSRSFQQLGSLDHVVSSSRNNISKREIISVICHVPCHEWQTVFGEDLKFKSGTGLAGFLQSQLDRSSTLRDERIANNELLSDGDWEAVNKIAQKGRQFIRPTDGMLYVELMMLEEAKERRPAKKYVDARLEAFVSQLEKKDVKRVRWSDNYVAEVKAIRDQVNPGEEAAQGWFEWLLDPSQFPSPVAASASLNPIEARKSAAVKDGTTWLLSTLRKFERSTDFRSTVNTEGLRVPESLMGKLLLTVYASHTIGIPHLVNNLVPNQQFNYAAGKPSTENTFSNPPAPPIGPSLDNPKVARPTFPSLPAFEQYFVQVDAVLTRVVNSMMPWDSTHADEILEMKSMLESACHECLSAEPSASHFTKMKIELGNFLARMSETLLSTGVAVLGRAGDLIEQNPVKTAGVLAAYMVISNFYASWFLPEPEELIDPLQGVISGLDLVPDEASITYDNIIEGIEDLFEDLPEFAIAVKKLISQSDYLDPADDRKLIEELEALLQQTVPGNQNITYQDCLDTIIQLAIFDAQDEFEDDPDSEPTTGPTATISVDPLMGGMSVNGRRKRSVEGDLNKSLGKPASDFDAPAAAGWLIQAEQNTLDAEIKVQLGEEIVPGVTIEQAADKFIDAITEAQTIFDPLFFMNTVINNAVSTSELPDNIKSALNADTEFKVEFNKRRPAESPGNYFPNNRYRYETFTLAQLFAGQHEKAREFREEIKILWPSGYVESFKKVVADNDFQTLYKESVNKLIAKPEIVGLWKAGKKYEIINSVKNYLQDESATDLGREIVNGYLKGHVSARSITIANGALSQPDDVVNAVFLPSLYSNDGLFVFLGENGAIIESPTDLFKYPGRSIEEFPQLCRELSKRISMKSLLSRGENDFKYSQGKNGWGDFPIKLPYLPIKFGFAEKNEDGLMEVLYQRQASKMLSDIDTMTSTESERITDSLLELLSASLTMFSTIAAFVPTGGFVLKGLAMLLGVVSSGVDYVRGVVHDDPRESARHKANGLRGAIFQLSAPFLGKLLGTTISKTMGSRVAVAVIGRLKSIGTLSPGVIKYLYKNGGALRGAFSAVGKVPKWIRPAVKEVNAITSKMESKFKNVRVINRLNRLDKGPQVAQKLMDKTGTVYFDGAQNGYVYQGFVMRGDMRLPKDVFRDGFKLRTPITDVKQVNGMKGGFGGGKNSLDPDGMGISTSAFYKDSGAGAFHYGGGRGGYTYLIDGRDMKGFDLYRNHHYASLSHSKIGFRPWEINYGNNIPGSKILGAYGPNGVFIPNPNALKSSIAASIPDPLVTSVPIPKLIVKQSNSTSAAS